MLGGGGGGGGEYLSIPKRQPYDHGRMGMDKQFHPTVYWTCDYLSMLVIMLINVSKGATGISVFIYRVDKNDIGTCYAIFMIKHYQTTQKFHFRAHYYL